MPNIYVCCWQVGSLCIGRAGACVVRLPNSWLLEFGSSVASRPGLAPCHGCLFNASPSLCPCQPVACPLLPKTFRSAGTSTERNVSTTSAHVGQTRRMASYTECMHPATRDVLFNRRTQQPGAVRPDSDQKQRSHDVGCGFVQFCHKHIFANPTAISSVLGRTRKVSQSPASAMSSESHCGSLNAHFNPCYSNRSPPDDDDDDDDVNLDAIGLCDSLCSSHTRRTHALPAVSEMSESCFEGLQSSTHEQVIDLSRRFRPLSWAGPADDCSLGSRCSCSNQSAFCAPKSETFDPPGAQLLNSDCQIASDELCVPLSGETPFYWELELPGTTSSTNLISQTPPVSEACQKVASPLRMGTHSFDTGSVLESSSAHAATKKLLPNKSSYQNSGYVVDTAAAPTMGCSPARCLMCRDCQLVCCSASAINRHNQTVSAKTPLPREVRMPRACKCVKQRRCPTPPRMLSPCANDDDSLRVPVADI